MIENENYLVSGMTCAACQAHVDKAVKKLKGVKEVNVSLLTNSMTVTYDSPASSQAICDAVSQAGYKAKLLDSNKKKVSNERELFEDKQTPKLLRRLIISLILLIPLFYISMGYMNPSWNWPLWIFRDNPFYFGLVEMILSLIIMLINYPFFTSGFKSLFHGGPNMDTLVALGSGIAFVYGIVVMFMMSSNLSASMNEDTWNRIMILSMGLTFETAGMVPTLITIGKTLESYSKGKTTSAIKSLLDLAPKTARVIRNNEEIIIPADEVAIGDIFLIKPGESLPVDGIILEGSSAVNESMLTGESIPVDKNVNDKVYTGTINQDGFLKCQAEKVGSETSLHQIIEMVQNASSSKTKISSLADKVAGIFVPVVLIIALIVFILWLIFGRGFVNSLGDGTTLITYSIERAISVLVVSCPCALGLATPTAIMVGSGKAAKNGILFKNALALEETGKMEYIVLDKTGTITNGNPIVTDIIPNDGIKEEELLTIAYSLESKSEHPLAKAIVNKCQEANLDLLDVSDFKSLIGSGIEGLINNKKAIAGKISLIEKYGVFDENILQKADILAKSGKTPLFFIYDDKLLGIIAVMDVPKEDSLEAINQFKQLGLIPIMLTGDNPLTAKETADKVGIEYYVADVLPNEKLEVISELQKTGKVLMVGDGINDAPALTKADIGFAIGRGTDVALDSADVIIMKNSLMDVAKAIRLSRQTLLNVKENLFWAFFYNLVMIPIAAGAFSTLGLAKLKPWYGALAMAISSVTVVLNALRLNFYNLNNFKSHNRKVKTPIPNITKSKGENNQMKKELLIEGMMCQHCVRHVTEALEKVDGVSKVDVSLEKNNAIIEVDDSVKDETLKEAIEAAGYKVTKIQ